jgi:uncharacterized membrane protein
MNTNSNKPHPQDDASRSVQDEPRATATKATVEAGSKLLEAEATLVEAEARLIDSNSTAKASEPRALVPRAPEPRPPAVERIPVETTRPTPSGPVTERLSENVAGMLCYLFGWASGLVFLLIDRRPYVRFHAAQSVAIFAALSVVLLALSGFLVGALLPGAGVALLVIRRVVELVWLAAAVVLMLKAAGGEWFRVRVASQYADRVAHAAK